MTGQGRQGSIIQSSGAKVQDGGQGQESRVEAKAQHQDRQGSKPGGQEKERLTKSRS